MLVQISSLFILLTSRINKSLRDSLSFLLSLAGYKWGLPAFYLSTLNAETVDIFLWSTDSSSPLLKEWKKKNLKRFICFSLNSLKDFDLKNCLFEKNSDNSFFC